MIDMKRTLYLITFLIAIPCLGFAQQVIKGRVVAQKTNEPLPGVNIVIKENMTGTVTDQNGEFSLEIDPAVNNIIVVSFVGFGSKTIDLLQLNDLENLSITLQEKMIGLEEVVISGQGDNISKRRLSTEVTSVDGQSLKEIPSIRLDQLLQSKLPNVQLRLASGQPGTASIIRSRGPVSAFVNSAPIIYIDGIRLDNTNTPIALGLVTSGLPHQGATTSAIPDIPVENIEKVEFINGGAAATLFGSDAANGVLQIITKKGGSRESQLFFETQMGVETPTNEFLHFDRTGDLLFQNGFVQKYGFGANGGNNDFGYSFSGSVFQSDGVRIHDQNQNRRYDLMMGLSAKVKEGIEYEGAFGYVNNRFNRVRNGNAGGYTGLWFTEGARSAFTGPGFNNDLDELTDEEFEEMNAYVSEAERLQNFESAINRIFTSQTLRFFPLPSLSIKATAGLDIRLQDESGIVTNEYLNHTRAASSGEETTTEGSISTFTRNFIGLTLELTGRHQFEMQDFSFITTFGGQIFRTDDEQIASLGTNLVEGAFVIGTGDNLNAANTLSEQVYFELANYGAYLVENIGFKNKYFLEFGFRIDGNSAFGDQVGGQFFPKAGFAYLMSEEPFFENQWVSTLKLRGNIGYAGNLPSPFGWEKTVAFGTYDGNQTATLDQPGNPDLGAERTRTIEVGTDIGLLNDRITLSAVYYDALTTDAIFAVPPLPSSGFTTAIEANIGEIKNNGFEFRTNIRIIDRPDASLSFTAAYNTLNNEVQDAGGSAPFPINGFSQRTIQTMVEEGESIGFLRGNRGTFNAEGVMVETTPQQNLGQTLPESFGSFGLNAYFKGFNFFTRAEFQTGAYAHSFERQFRYFYGASQEGIPDAEIAENERRNWLNFTDQFVEKTDFLKFRSIGVSYDFDPNMINIKQVTVGFTVTNPLNFVSSSFDPEATQIGGRQRQQGATTGGIAYGVQSAPRQWMGNIRIRF